ncbi:HAD-IA family hydrolase [Micromonospora mirobrigensis]|uniref:Haloacid dehalogenase superfamily, subfamily IA, variant 3 with third motif having DD or ED/haloacid dehalogenase superfamily, subfamily IA, variant 1 with third motif having Dx(3-4)D or Dx(3-4)E n=1 Tax=Micromonospora mirobrigensis TaxID=262898 RepID=A0A1C4YW79_9ACTN|nr:HAD-IA family hydrolase [Micromonospora mirobrigensis]SCF24934.1 haloacid dehalogenase superfamily, subfamily IA, variant 3 with third motif having DD or ED/haloacid dehalogenase superfamily, subfamily IA, variant 1 with third motif having Dx(3-4)D or Dx(3-4)E [Micromonospora mirobrigensis]
MTAAVLFDLDGTLLDHAGAARRAVTAWAATVAPGAGDEPALAAAWSALEREHFAAYLAGECSFQEQRRRRLRGFLPLLGSPVDEARLDDRFADYLRHYEAAWRVYPDVADALVGLRCHGYRLGVLTNGDARQQRRKLAAIGLGDAFDVVCCSAELGVAKPDPAAFRLAAARLGHQPRQLRYVGDDPDTDHRAACRAGLHGTWLDRTVRRADVSADRVDRLTRLPELRPATAVVPGEGHPASWRAALDRFAELVGRRTAWAVTGSAAAALHGAVVTPGDVDVVTDPVGLAALRRRFGDATVTEPFRAAGVSASARLRVELDGTPFEVLVGVRNRRPDGSWSAPATPDDRLWIPSSGRLVPVLPLSSLLRVAEERGRAGQGAAIRRRLGDLRIGERALPSDGR